LIEKHGGVTVMAYATLAGSVPVVALSLPAGLAVDWSAMSIAIWIGTLWAVIVSLHRLARLGWSTGARRRPHRAAHVPDAPVAAWWPGCSWRELHVDQARRRRGDARRGGAGAVRAAG